MLGVRLKRAAFDEILSHAVPSSFDPERYPGREAWAKDVETSDVRLQWDPDHDPGGRPLERRAIQLGLRGKVLAQYAKSWLLGVEDLTPFVREQAGAKDPLTPREDVYPVKDPAVAARLGL